MTAHNLYELYCRAVSSSACNPKSRDLTPLKSDDIVDKFWKVCFPPQNAHLLSVVVASDSTLSKFVLQVEVYASKKSRLSILVWRSVSRVTASIHVCMAVLYFSLFVYVYVWFCRKYRFSPRCCRPMGMDTSKLIDVIGDVSIHDGSHMRGTSPYCVSCIFDNRCASSKCGRVSED